MRHDLWEAVGDAWDFVVDHRAWLIAAGLVFAGWLWARLSNVLNPEVETWLKKQLNAFRARREERRKQKAIDKKDSDHKAHLAKLAHERIGQRFLKKDAPDDEGVIGVVVELGRQHPEKDVVVVWAPGPNQEPEPQNAEFGQRSQIEWRSLMKSAAEQKHMTARLEFKSDNDEDGYCYYTRLDPAKDDD